MDEVAIDHYPCYLKGFDRAARRMGEAIAKRRNQAVLDVILGNVA